MFGSMLYEQSIIVLSVWEHDLRTVHMFGVWEHAVRTVHVLSVWEHAVRTVHMFGVWEHAVRTVHYCVECLGACCTHSPCVRCLGEWCRDQCQSPHQSVCSVSGSMSIIIYNLHVKSTSSVYWSMPFRYISKAIRLLVKSIC